MLDMQKDPEIVGVAGDWHGSSLHGRQAIQYAAMKGASLIVQCGDFGLWPGTGGQDYLRVLNKACEQNNVDVWWLPGNHEDYDQIAEIELAGTDEPITMGKYSRLHYLPRGVRWQWWGKNFMALGGAISVDRKWRIEGESYWPAEVLTDADVEHALREPHGMDVIFSHDCPQGVMIPGIGPDSKQRPGEMIWPADVMYESQQSRLKLRKVWSVHKPQLWFHGHFHVDYEFWLGETKFRGLNMDGGKMIENMTFLTEEDLK